MRYITDKLTPWEVQAALTFLMQDAEVEKAFATALPQIYNKLTGANVRVELTQLLPVRDDSR